MAFNKSFKQDAVITPQTGITDLSASTGGLNIPVGTSAQRPVVPVGGGLRYNTTEGFIETFTASGWKKIVPQAYDYLVAYLIVAGGGGGASANYGGSAAGGGGGGGYLAASNVTFTPGTVYTVTVGAGGSRGVQGSNSSISGFTVAIGGGLANGGSGGSGGGGSGAGTSGQGNNGGSNTQYGGGGGGGAAAVGTDSPGGASPALGGAGGAGSSSSITGSAVTRAGGGGGGGGSTASGGAGGGGAGGNTGGGGSTGTVNTGGGGGGGFPSGTGGAAGGSGVVILSIPTASYTGTITGGPTVTTSGSNTILVFNASGSYTA
jgi:hypothetical protein